MTNVVIELPETRPQPDGQGRKLDRGLTGSRPRSAQLGQACPAYSLWEHTVLGSPLRAVPSTGAGSAPITTHCPEPRCWRVAATRWAARANCHSGTACIPRTAKNPDRPLDGITCPARPAVPRRKQSPVTYLLGNQPNTTLQLRAFTLVRHRVGPPRLSNWQNPSPMKSARTKYTTT